MTIEPAPMSSSGYVPGTCNIGKAEIAQRKQIGWIGLVVTVLLWVLLFSVQAAPAWFLFLFLPATLSAVGFIQAFSHFCVAFGMKGLFNVSPELRKMESVAQAEFRGQDKKKAIRILISSLAVGAAVALVAYFLR